MAVDCLDILLIGVSRVINIAISETRIDQHSRAISGRHIDRSDQYMDGFRSRIFRTSNIRSPSTKALLVYSR